MDDLALPNHPITAAELRARGITETGIRRLVHARRLRRLLRGVYVRADVPDTLELRAAALGGVVADHHVVVDRTAAWLHGVDVLTYAEHEVLPPVETCALRGRQPTGLSAVLGRSRDLAARDIMRLHGWPITTPLRTSLDLGCNLRRRDAFAVMNEFARVHRISRAMLFAEETRFRGRRGVVQARGLIPLVTPRVGSIRESWTLLEVVDAGLPKPELQYWVEVDGRPTYRLDFAWPRLRVCLEYDGYDWHERTAEQREYDERRRQWLRDHGWTVIVIHTGDFTEPQLSRWLAELTLALQPTYSNRRW